MVRWSGGQVARWSGGQVVRWSGGQVARWSGGQVVRWSGGQVITDHWSGEISEMANLICADDFGATEAASASSADSDPPAQDRPSYTTLATCPYLHLPTHQYLHLHLPLHQTTLANVAHQSLGTCLEPEVTNRRKITMNIVIRTKMMIISTILM